MQDDERSELHERLEEAVRRHPDTQETLELAAAALELKGQCRLETPYADLRPVLTAEGLRWCCTHETEHCSDAIEPLE
jgi:hypothetical protein